MKEHTDKTNHAQIPETGSGGAGSLLPVYAVLAILLFVVYLQVLDFSFVNYDDHLYVEDNANIQAGLTLENVAWAFTDATRITNFWAPLTWLSILIDYELFGVNAGGYHLTNLLLHVANSLLVLMVFHRLTGARWRSALVAALFAFHPLHVESVAWVTERKDVLSTFFWLLTMGAYARYAESPNGVRYLAAFCCFVLGMMAKPMLVTLPFVLLLLDYWPLKRLQCRDGSFFPAGMLQRVMEKIPYFLIVGMMSVFVYLSQHRGEALTSLGQVPLWLRLQNVVVAYGTYLWQTVWPFGLSVGYPYPYALDGKGLLASVFILVFFSWGTVRRIRRTPWLAVGWLWYLGTLVPVIGIVVIAEQATADRYTYVPLIGIFVILSWGLGSILGNDRTLQRIGGIAIIGVTGCFMLLTWRQAGFWKDSRTLFGHALAVNADNYLAHNGMGYTLARQGRWEAAVRHYRRALAIRPGGVDAHFNLAGAYAALDRNDLALEHYRQVLQVRPDDYEAHNNIGNIWALRGDYRKAAESYLAALRYRPDYGTARRNLEKIIQAAKAGPGAATIAREAGSGSNGPKK